ncbi:MAG: polysaccharide pyruvyl transferase family protein [Bacteroidaceae bacterium]
MRKIKTATVTWITYRNFGTFLQAFALQKVIQSLGFENVILDDASVLKDLRTHQNSILRITKDILRPIVKSFMTHTSSYRKLMFYSDKLYDAFKENHLQIDHNIQYLSSVGQKYDIFLCGSDQIWHPIEGIFHPYFYLSFTDKKKVAYAPSIGTSTYPEEFKSRTKPLLERFDSIAVREEIGANLLKSFIDKPVDVVLDPTLLLTSGKWNELISDTVIKDEEPYALCYFLTENRNYLNQVKRYAKEKSLRIKIFGTNPNYMNFGDEVLFCGPKEFLLAIRDASIVFTDSFHATIFSIHFERDFYTFKRFKDGEKKNQNSRLLNLFSMIEYSERFVGEEHFDKIGKQSPINYIDVNKKIEVQRVHSMNYLTKALEGTWKQSV